MLRPLALFAMLILAATSGCASAAEGQGRAAVLGAVAAEASGSDSTGNIPSGTTPQSSERKAAKAKRKDLREPDEDPAKEGSLFSLKSSALGGRLFWTDELVFHDWRIQRNSDDGRYRLIDRDEKAASSGTFEECRARLEAIKKEQKLPPLSGKVVLVLHGLGRSRTSTAGMVKYLRDNSAYTVLSVGYASTQADVTSHAHALGKVIQNLGDQVDEINFVAHSLGNIVIRRYLASTIDADGVRPDPRIQRIVMVGAPNHGAWMAQLVGRSSMFERIAGQSGQEMGQEWKKLEQHLAIPKTEFGIIAGGKHDADGYNPLLPGDDDLIVAVEETKLPGARDFLVVDGIHALLLSNPQVQKTTLQFLQHGYFVTEEARHSLSDQKTETANQDTR